MPNSNPQAVAFANGRCRVVADLMASLYATCKRFNDEWNAQSVATVIPNDSTVIADGSATDGRPQITNAQATNLVTRAQELINWMERGTLNASGTQNNATLSTVLAAAVNGQSKF